MGPSTLPRSLVVVANLALRGVTASVTLTIERGIVEQHDGNTTETSSQTAEALLAAVGLSPQADEMEGLVEAYPFVREGADALYRVGIGETPPADTFELDASGRDPSQIEP